jgi:hypothetical protein
MKPPSSSSDSRQADREVSITFSFYTIGVYLLFLRDTSSSAIILKALSDIHIVYAKIDVTRLYGRLLGWQTFLLKEWCETNQTEEVESCSHLFRFLKQET